MSKHTPGPWVVSADPLHFHSLTTVIGGKESLQKNGPPQQMIVQVGGFAEWQEAEANARLIAAAPELLEVLRLMVAMAETGMCDFNPHDEYVMDKAKAVIDKATGCTA